MSAIRNFFRPPRFDDPDRTRIAAQLHYILLIGVPIASFFAIEDGELLRGQPTSGDIIPGIVALVLCLQYILLRSGAVRWVSGAMITAAFAAIVTTSALNGGVRDVSLLVMPLLLMLTSIFLGWKATVVLAICISLWAATLISIEWSGMAFPQSTVAEQSYLTITLVVVWLTTVLLRLTVRQIMDNAAQVHAQAHDLQRQNDALEQTQAELAQEMAERAKAEAALHQTQKLESIGLLAGGVAHDFNNLLTGIMAQTSLALTKLNDDHPACANIVKALKSSERAEDLTRQLLAYAGKTSFQIEPIDLNRLITENVSLLETAIRARAKLNLNLQNGIPTIETDRGQMQQILFNLVFNASDAIEHDAGQITVSTHYHWLNSQSDATTFIGDQPSPGSYVCLTVSDNGTGIAADTLTKIFDPFFSTKEDGHGLGLSAVYGVVSTLDGGVQVESSVGKGSRFAVFLPASGKQPLPARHLAKGEYENMLNDELILVVDDEDSVREVAAEILEMVGYQTLCAASGEDAIMPRSNNIRTDVGLILLDMQMPGMDGAEAYTQLRALDAKVPVLFSSGYSNLEISQQLPGVGADDFLSKPYNIDVLIAKVGAALER